jgi:hypothetical protein
LEERARHDRNYTISLNTRRFKLDNDKGGLVTRPPQRYYRVIPPPDDALRSPNIDDKRRSKPRKTTSPGANVTFTKDGHSADPQHAKIVNALAKSTHKRWLES